MQSIPSPSSTALTSLRTSPPPSEIECERRHAAPVRLHLEGRHVEGLGALPLHLVVVDHRVGPRHHLGDRAGEIGARARVGLDQGELAVLARHEEVARERHRGPPCRLRWRGTAGGPAPRPPRRAGPRRTRRRAGTPCSGPRRDGSRTGRTARARARPAPACVTRASARLATTTPAGSLSTVGEAGGEAAVDEHQPGRRVEHQGRRSVPDRSRRDRSPGARTCRGRSAPRWSSATPPAGWWGSPGPRSARWPSGASRAPRRGPPRRQLGQEPLVLGQQSRQYRRWHRPRRISDCRAPSSGTHRLHCLRGSLRRHVLEPGVALLLQLQGQLLAARADDPAVDQHVHEVGHDVVEQPLVVGDHQERSGPARAGR